VDLAPSWAGKVYKSKGWARRAAAKLQYFCVDTHRDGFIVRPMTPLEKRYRDSLAAIENIEMEAFKPQIEKLLTTDCGLFNLVRRR
jgi:hypothetical protein